MKEEELDYEYYGCFFCGTIEGQTVTVPGTSEIYCAECGEAGVISLSEALKLIGQMHEDGRIYPHFVNGFTDEDEEE